MLCIVYCVYCRRVLREYAVLLLELVVAFALLWLATNLTQQHVQPISRRLVNLTYILWIVSPTPS